MLGPGVMYSFSIGVRSSSGGAGVSSVRILTTQLLPHALRLRLQAFIQCAAKRPIGFVTHKDQRKDKTSDKNNKT